jgi:hypothetical protein
MNHVNSQILPTNIPQADRLRVIRRSVRCRVFGVLGLVPFFGLSLAWLAIRLHRQVLAETGESWRIARIRVYFVAGLVFTALSLLAGEPLAGLLAAHVFLLLQLYLLFWQYRNGRVVHDIPTRRLLYQGRLCAQCGWFLSALIAVLWVISHW